MLNLNLENFLELFKCNENFNSFCKEINDKKYNQLFYLASSIIISVAGLIFSYSARHLGIRKRHALRISVTVSSAICLFNFKKILDERRSLSQLYGSICCINQQLQSFSCIIPQAICDLVNKNFLSIVTSDGTLQAAVNTSKSCFFSSPHSNKNCFKEIASLNQSDCFQLRGKLDLLESLAKYKLKHLEQLPLHFKQEILKAQQYASIIAFGAFPRPDEYAVSHQDGQKQTFFAAPHAIYGVNEKV